VLRVCQQSPRTASWAHLKWMSVHKKSLLVLRRQGFFFSRTQLVPQRRQSRIWIPQMSGIPKSGTRLIELTRLAGIRLRRKTSNSKLSSHLGHNHPNVPAPHFCIRSLLFGVRYSTRISNKELRISNNEVWLHLGHNHPNVPAVTSAYTSPSNVFLSVTDQERLNQIDSCQPAIA
jgi:hypothetical protein